jgi:hypothetical protein
LPRHIPGYAGHYPWWAYCSRPDLRRERHFKLRGERYALIELDLPLDRVVLFPCGAWDRIYIGEFLSPVRGECEQWERRLREAVPDLETDPLPEPWQTELEASWQRLFDPELPVQGWPLDEPWRFSEREAVFEVLERRSVRRITPFLGADSAGEPRQPYPMTATTASTSSDKVELGAIRRVGKEPTVGVETRHPTAADRRGQ